MFSDIELKKDFKSGQDNKDFFNNKLKQAKEETQKLRNILEKNIKNEKLLKKLHINFIRPMLNRNGTIKNNKEIEKITLEFDKNKSQSKPTVNL